MKDFILSILLFIPMTSIVLWQVVFGVGKKHNKFYRFLFALPLAILTTVPFGLIGLLIFWIQWRKAKKAKK